MAELWIVRADLVPYAEAFEAQRRIAEARVSGRVPDVLLLLEHPPVYTKGRRTTPAELPMGEDWYRMQGIEVCETDRGGRVTYHGPGQVVGYPIVSLKPYGDDVHHYVRGLERVVIDALAGYGVGAHTIEGLTGIWVGADPAAADAGAQAESPSRRRGQGVLAGAEQAAGGDMGERKIGSIGVHVSRGVTTHGFAVNVNNDLQPFEWVVPCGIDGCRVTSLTRELGAEQDLDAFTAAVAQRFADVFEREPVEAQVADLGVFDPMAAAVR